MKKHPMYKYLIMLTIASTIGLQGWRTIFNNFAVDTINLNGYQIGIVQTVREIPGFLAVLVIFTLCFLKEYRLSVISIFFMVLGIALTGFLSSFEGLILTTLIMSIGFHFYETTNQSLTMQYFSEKETPIFFSLQRSLSAAANIFIGVLIFFLSFIVEYKSLFLIVAGIVLIIVIWAVFQKPSDGREKQQLKKIVLRRKYWLFYVLTLLSGARRQIFVVFSVFLLVKKFNFSIREITILFVINNIINYFICPLIGKAINRFGEKRLLGMEYGSLIFIFLAYAFVESKILVGFLYILDHIFFNFAIGIKTYFKKIANKEDIAPSMAVSFTINHLAAVVLPLVGGALWLINYRLPFIIGSFLSLLSFVFIFYIPSKE